MTTKLETSEMLKLTGNKNTDMKILSYYTYNELRVLEKHSKGVKELMENPKFWAIKLKQDCEAKRT